MPDGSIVICDGNIGELLRWDGSSMSTFAATGGSPWGAVLGSDGAIYVTQGGNVPGSPDQSAVAGIQRVGADGSVEMLSTEIGGHALAGPNDLAFGPDGRLWFTDSGTEQDDRFAAEDRAPGRLFVLGTGGAGEFLMERPDVYPNGIAFDSEGRLYWTESAAHRVCRLEDGEATTFCQLSDGHVPDGMAFAADGRAFVCTTISGGVTVLSAEGEVLEEISLGEHATNCIFDGPALYVTATKVAEIHADQRTGTFWRVETDATGPLPLLPGSL
jgi:gluconolactonase